jgi:membrane-associated phospholipid phosphatase
MPWLQSLDLTLFLWFNQSLQNPLLDHLFPLITNKSLLLPLALISLPLLWWHRNQKLRTCLVFLILTITLGDILICGPLKKSIARPRPHASIPETRLLTGRGQAISMPSSHAANWFAAAAILFFFYPKSIRATLPLAVTVSLSRVYAGAHYPSDVLAGACLGTLYASTFIHSSQFAWKYLGPRWFPLWHAQYPSLSNLPTSNPPPTPISPNADRHWLILAYLLIGLLLAIRLAYIASGTIDLSEDEAYQWLWSKNLALSYYSKPPLIALTQRLGTTLWGDNAFGIRFFSPVIAAILSLLILRFTTRLSNPRIGFLLILIITATPLLAVGASLMTVDPLSVLFWTAAMLSGWYAIQKNSTPLWAWTGLWMGLGFLSKYVALFQWLSWLLFFLLWKPARSQLRRPGPYLALTINLLLTLPVLWWNSQNNWIGLLHIGDRGGLHNPWLLTTRFFIDFTTAQFALLNPLFLLAILGALLALRHHSNRSQLNLFLFSMGAPLLIACTLYTFRSRVHPNWIAPAVIPLLILALLYWNQRFTSGARFVKPCLATGITLGLTAVVLLHETRWIGKLTGTSLPPHLDPLRRVRGWQECANLVADSRNRLLSEGKPVFIVTDHYGIAALLTFYLPEAKAAFPHEPFIFCLNADRPRNQFHLWPGYLHRNGHNALYVREGSKPKIIPQRLHQEFNAVTPLGLHHVPYRRRPMHALQFAACRDLL